MRSGKAGSARSRPSAAASSAHFESSRPGADPCPHGVRHTARIIAHGPRHADRPRRYRKRTEPGPFLPGPQFSSTYTSPGEPSDNALTYGRFHNPTWTAWEDALRVLEGGEAVAFASGMAAVDAVFGTTLRPGDVVVLAADCYYTVRRLAAGWLEPLGIEVRLVPTRGNAQSAALAGAKLVWVETPTNPQLDICDIAAMVDAARSRGVIVAVDNTTATPYLQQPLHARRRLRRRVGRESDHRPQRSDPRSRRHTGRGEGNGLAHLADSTWRDSGADGGLAGAPVTADVAGARHPAV